MVAGHAGLHELALLHGGIDGNKGYTALGRVQIARFARGGQVIARAGVNDTGLVQQSLRCVDGFR